MTTKTPTLSQDLELLTAAARTSPILRDAMRRVLQALADLPHLESVAKLVGEAKAVRGTGRDEQGQMMTLTSKLYRTHDELERARLARKVEW